MKLLDLIKTEEGFKSKVYKDTLGYDTVGYGFKVDCLNASELALNGGVCEPMSKEVATQILKGKVEELKSKIKADSELAFILTLNSVASDILLSMAYQLGISGLKGFKKMLAAFRAGDYATASREMLNSRWAKQTPNRAKRASEAVEGLA